MPRRARTSLAGHVPSRRFRYSCRLSSIPDRFPTSDEPGLLTQHPGSPPTKLTASERHAQACRHRLSADALAHLVVVAEVQHCTRRQQRIQVETQQAAVAGQANTRQRLPLLHADETGVEHITMRCQGALPLRVRAEIQRAPFTQVPVTTRAYAEACLPAVQCLCVAAQAKATGTLFGKTTAIDARVFHIDKRSNAVAAIVQIQPDHVARGAHIDQ